MKDLINNPIQAIESSSATFNITEMISITAFVLFLMVVSLYLVGHLMKFAWAWVDRGESDMPHILDIIIPTYGVSNGEDPYSSQLGQFHPSLSHSDEFLTKKGAEDFIKSKGLKNSTVVKNNCAALKLRAVSICIYSLALLGILLNEFPSQTLWVTFILTSVFGSRYLRDMYKLAKKLKNKLDSHINDKDAHNE